MTFTSDSLAAILGTSGRVAGDRAATFRGLKSLGTATPADIAWLRPKAGRTAAQLPASQAGCIICVESDWHLLQASPGHASCKTAILTDVPEFIFRELLVAYERQHPSEDASEERIHPTAVVHPGAVLGDSVRIGAYSVIGSCTIGDHTVIGDHVKLFKNVRIGSHCTIREFCSIGGAGFGMVADGAGNNVHIPHIGGVVIGDFVQIFPYTNIDRSTLDDTVVHDHAVIDHYCHIGHNTSVGRNTIVTAQVVLAGGSAVGERCFIGVNTIVKQKVAIGSGVTTGMGAVVTHSIPDGQTWVGNPAIPLEEAKKQRESLKRMP